MLSFSEILIKIDNYSSYVPLFSSVVNLIDIFHKYVTIPHIEKTGSLRNPYFAYLKAKDPDLCKLLLIPILGNIFAVYTFVKKTSSIATSPNFKIESPTVKNGLNPSFQTDEFKINIAELMTTSPISKPKPAFKKSYKQALRYEKNKDYKKASELYLDLSYKKGCFKSINNLAMLYLKGLGVDEDAKCAFELLKNVVDVYIQQLLKIRDSSLETEMYKKLAKLGLGTLFNNLGSLYMKGMGTIQDFDEAYKCFSYATYMEHPAALYNLALCYKFGRGTEQNLTSAFNYFTLGAEKEHLRSIYELGRCFENGIGVEPNLKEALDLYEIAAKEDLPIAKYAFATLLIKCKSSPENNKIAFDYFNETAARYLPAKLELARCYLEGIGVVPNELCATKIYLIVAQRGNMEAICNLVNILASKNMKMALPYIKLAAQAGIVKYMHMLAKCYEKGNGIEKDIDQALIWFKKAAKKGYAKSCNHLGMLYEYGEEVEIDFSLAAHFYQQAAEAKDSDGLINLGRCFEEGIGVTQDFQCALGLYAGADNDVGRIKHDALQEKIKETSEELENVANLHRSELS